MWVLLHDETVISSQWLQCNQWELVLIKVGPACVLDDYKIFSTRGMQCITGASMSELHGALVTA